MTLSFTWATNANYSTGPDTGSATKVDPASTANGFIAGVIAAPQHVNYLFDLVGDELAKAVDGINGGTYTLGSNLIFQGAGEVRFAGVARVTSGGTMVVDGASTFNNTATFNGDIALASDLDVASGANINFASGADQVMGSGSTLQVSSGGFIIMAAGASQFIDAANDIVISNESRGFRLGMTPTWIEQVAGTNSWDMIGAPGTWVQTNVAAQRFIMLPLTLPPGDDIVSISCQANGTSAGGAGHATIPASADRLTVYLVSVDSAGAVTTHASLADPSVNAAAYDVSHVFSLVNGAAGMTGTLPHTVLSASAYYILIEGESGANAVANTLGVTAVFGTYTARSFLGSGTSMHLP